MATITKTASGTWKVLIRRRGYPTEIKTFPKKSQAEDWARDIENQMVRGLYISRSNAERMLVADALDRYLKEVTTTKKASTQSRERFRYETLREFFGKYSVAAVTPDIVARFRDARLAEGLSNNSVRLELALLGHLYSVAIKEWGLGLIVNPVHLIRKPSPGAARDRRLQDDESDQLLAAIAAHSNPMLLWVVVLAIETGMRLSELITLTREQVDIGRRIIRLSDTKNGSARTVPLTDTASAVMKDAIANPIRPIDTDLIFFGEPGRDGKRKPYVFNSVWQRVLKKIGIEDFRFHDLRHEAVSRFFEAGLSDVEVSTISGHKSMQMLRRYAHLRATNLIDKLDRGMAQRA
ncbi:MAG: site-specific integrase [Casimicrobium sp.]